MPPENSGIRTEREFLVRVPFAFAFIAPIMPQFVRVVMEFQKR